MPDVFLLIAQRSEHIPMWILRFYKIKCYFFLLLSMHCLPNAILLPRMHDLQGFIVVISAYN